jgi:hypothetical protein
MRRSLLVAIGAAVIAFTLLVVAGRLTGWGSSASDLLRWGGLAVAAGVWAQVLLPWLARHRTMNADEHQAGMYAGLRAWAVTDVVVILAWGLYT